MKTVKNLSDSFAADDIRRLRDEFDKRYTNENGVIDWKGATAETEAGAERVRAEIARIRVERNINIK
jgi:hypothetical protein